MTTICDNSVFINAIKMNKFDLMYKLYGEGHRMSISSCKRYNGIILNGSHSEKIKLFYIKKLLLVKKLNSLQVNATNKKIILALIKKQVLLNTITIEHIININCDDLIYDLCCYFRKMKKNYLRCVLNDVLESYHVKLFMFCHNYFPELLNDVLIFNFYIKMIHCGDLSKNHSLDLGKKLHISCKDLNRILLPYIYTPEYFNILLFIKKILLLITQNYPQL